MPYRFVPISIRFSLEGLVCGWTKVFYGLSQARAWQQLITIEGKFVILYFFSERAKVRLVHSFHFVAALKFGGDFT